MNSLSKFTNGRRSYIIPRVFPILLIIYVLGMCQLNGRGWGRSHWRSPCVTTAYLAYQSSLVEASADYTLARAKANNLPDYSDRMEALAEAREEYREASSLARDQLVARLELCDALDEDRYYPEIDPENFCTPEEIAANPNPYFMLIPGRVMTYGGETEEGEEEIIEVTVTNETIEILGVTCIEVHDLVTIDGEIHEDTRDWYAQDKEGTVWYFGEIALNFEDGQITDIDGSWKAGVDGALPGIQMWANPQVGQIYRQEFLLNEAEDIAEVMSLTETVVSNEIEYLDCLQNLEYTPLDPEVFEYKYYKGGVGLVLEENPDTGEITELLMVTP